MATTDLVTLAAETESLAVKATELKIETQAAYEMAADVLKAVKAQAKAIGEILDPEVEAAHKLHKEQTARRKGYLDPLAKIETLLKPKMAAYISAQERAKREADRLAYEAEQKRLAEAETRASEEAETLAALGLSGSVTATPEIVPPAKTMEIDQAGISYREVWRFEVIDPALVPREYLAIDETKLGGVVRALRSLAVIPGVRVWAEKLAVVR